MRVVSLAAHSQSIGQTLALVDNLPRRPRAAGDRAVAEPAHRRARRRRRPALRLAPGPDQPAPRRRAGRPHLAQEAPARAARRASSTSPSPTSTSASSRGRPTCRPSPTLATTIDERRSGRQRRSAKSTGSAVELARERPQYAANVAYNLALLADVVRLGREKGYAVTFFEQPLGPEASGPAWDAYLATYRADVAGVMRALGVPDVAVQPQAALRATTSPTCSTSSTRAATSGRRRSGARPGGRSDSRPAGDRRGVRRCRRARLTAAGGWLIISLNHDPEPAVISSPPASPAPATADIDAVFRAKGIPMTRQRRQVWEFFALGSRAATIAEATDGLREAGIGQATVYRTVTLLTDLGLLVRVQDRRGDIGFTAPPIGHSHPLVCGRLPPRGALRRRGRPDGARGQARRRDRLCHLRPPSRGLRRVRRLPAARRRRRDGRAPRRRGGRQTRAGAGGRETPAPCGRARRRRRPAVLCLVERRQGQLSRPAARRGRRRPSRRAAHHDRATTAAAPTATPCRLARRATGRGARRAARAAQRLVGRLRSGLPRRPGRAARRLGVGVGVFGDIDLQPHRDWVERVCARGRPAGLPAAVARAASRPARRAVRRRRGRHHRRGQHASASTSASSAAGSTRRSSPSSRPPASTPAARRASSTPSSPRRRCSPRPSPSPGVAPLAIDQYRFVDVVDEPSPPTTAAHRPR